MSARTPEIKDQHGKVIPNSIAEIKKIRIGGVNQYLMIRGNNTNNPVILFVHGGPG
jgi:acetyl esterase/lipase